MTTMTRTRINIRLVLGALAMTLAFSNAQAEDTHAGYGIHHPQYQHNAKSQAAVRPNYDQQYQIPNSYNGKYYPDDDSGAIGYHGTSNSAQNNTQGTGATPYYYYY